MGVLSECDEQFVIRYPNAKTTCGCGSSFSIVGGGFEYEVITNEHANDHLLDAKGIVENDH